MLKILTSKQQRSKLKQMYIQIINHENKYFSSSALLKILDDSMRTTPIKVGTPTHNKRSAELLEWKADKLYI